MDEDDAKLRGTRIHLLLENFAATPEGNWQNIAAAILPDAPDLDTLVNEAASVVRNPDLAFIFACDTLPEVPITAKLPELQGKTIYGIVDRLIVTEKEIWVIDFKTNVAVPPVPQSCPEGLLRQMGAYHAALKQIYPGRTLRPAIVWTRDASLMELPEALVSDALHRAGASMLLDGATPNT